MLAFAAPPLIRHEPLSGTELRYAIEVCGVDPDAVIEAQHIGNGPKWQMLRLRSAKDVLAANPVAKAPVGTDIGLAGPCGEGAITDWEVRAFFSNAEGRFVEDPVTGSFNAGFAVHLFENGLAKDRYLAAQGRKTGADGIVHCTLSDDGKIWIGGKCQIISSGGALLVFD